MMENMRLANGKIANYDELKKIHYGVINCNVCDQYALDDIYNNGTDVYYEEALAYLKSSVAAAIEDNPEATQEELKEILECELNDENDRFQKQCIEQVLMEESVADRVEAAMNYIDDEFGSQWESDCTVYDYAEDGYKIRLNTSDGDMFVIDSPYYTYCNQCSPCCPNAGYLTDRGGGMKSFCLGTEWFEDNKAPYDIYEVATGEKVYAVAEEQEDEDES